MSLVGMTVHVLMLKERSGLFSEPEVIFEKSSLRMTTCSAFAFAAGYTVCALAVCVATAVGAASRTARTAVKQCFLFIVFFRFVYIVAFLPII